MYFYIEKKNPNVYVNANLLKTVRLKVHKTVFFLKLFRNDEMNPAKSFVSLRHLSNSRMISSSKSGDVRKTKMIKQF